jgi:hypothetical protein
MQNQNDNKKFKIQKSKLQFKIQKLKFKNFSLKT